MYGEVEVKFHVFLTWTLAGVSDLLHAPTDFLGYSLVRGLNGSHSWTPVAKRKITGHVGLRIHVLQSLN